MLALRLPPEIEERLDALARKTGRSKSFYAREAILRQIEDIEDAYLAQRRLAQRGPRASLETLERRLQRRGEKSVKGSAKSTTKRSVRTRRRSASKRPSRK